MLSVTNATQSAQVQYVHLADTQTTSHVVQHYGLDETGGAFPVHTPIVDVSHHDA